MAAEHARVVIVGCGPVGLTLANLLGVHDVPALVLERNPGTVAEPRAIGIDAEGLRTMQAAGLYETVAQELVLGFHIEYLNGRGRRLFGLDVTTTPYGHPAIASFDQPVLERQLLEGLARFPHIEVRFGCEVETFARSDDAVTVKGVDPSGSAFEVECEYLLGCDGGRSIVRDTLGIQMSGHTAPERWLVIDTLDLALMDELPCRFFCDPARPAMTMAKKGRKRRWEFMLLPGERDEDLLDDRRIRMLLAPHTRADRVEIERKCVYTFHSIVADRYREGRVIIAGDAAHMMPPFAGQGMNSGIRDALNLSWKLPLLLSGRAEPALLDSYELERRGHVIAATDLANRLGRLIQPTSRLRAALRDAFFYGVNLTRRGQQAFERSLLRQQMAPSLHAGAFVPYANARGRTPMLAGRMLIQPRVRSAALESFRLDDALGAGFAVLGYRIDPALALDDETRAYWRELGARFVHVTPRGTAPTGDAVEDVEDAIGELFGDHVTPFLVVRPDRFIAAQFEGEHAQQTIANFDRLLRPSQSS